MQPNFKPARPIPSPNAWRVAWSKGSVDEAIATHDYGNFMASALLIEAMMRDDTLDAVLSTRVLSLLGLPIQFDPPHGTPEARLGEAKNLSRLVEVAHPHACPMSALIQLVRWGVMLGVGVAQVHWEVNETATLLSPRLEVWHPMHVMWRWDTRSYWVNTQEGVEEIVPGTGRWVLFTPYGEERGWMHGAVRSLGLVWLAREFVRRDWLRWSETFSIGIRKAIVPASADDEAKDKFHAQVASLGSETTVLLQKADSGEGFDIDVLFPSAGDASGGFQALMDKLESRMAIRILGQNLSTEVSGGSFAAADVHYRVLQGLLSADGLALGETLRRDVWQPWAEHNFGTASLAPSVMWRVAPIEDKAGDASVASTVIAAIVQATQAGLPIDARAMLERAGVPVLSRGEAVARTAPQAPPGAPPADAKRPDVVGPAAPAVGPAKGDEEPEAPAPSPPPPGDGAAPTAHRLAAPGQRHQVPVRRAQIDGRMANDGLGDLAAGQASGAFGSLVNDVLDAIANGRSYDDVRARLTASYRASEAAARAAEIAADSYILGQLQGRLAALGEADAPEPDIHVPGRKMKRAPKGVRRG